MIPVVEWLGQPEDTTNKAAIDSWTPVHVVTGIAAGALGIPFWTYAAVAAGYEVLEYAHEWPKGSRLFGSKRPESAVNVMMDLVAGAVGFAAGAYWASRR